MSKKESGPHPGAWVRAARPLHCACGGYRMLDTSIMRQIAVPSSPGDRHRPPLIVAATFHQPEGHQDKGQAADSECHHRRDIHSVSASCPGQCASLKRYVRPVTSTAAPPPKQPHDRADHGYDAGEHGEFDPDIHGCAASLPMIAGTHGQRVEDIKPAVVARRVATRPNGRNGSPRLRRQR